MQPGNSEVSPWLEGYTNFNLTGSFTTVLSNVYHTPFVKEGFTMGNSMKQKNDFLIGFKSSGGFKIVFNWSYESHDSKPRFKLIGNVDIRGYSSLKPSGEK